MAFLVSEIEGRVLRLLQKSASTPGFYTPERVHEAVQDSVDYVAVRMFRAVNGEWMDSIRYFDTTSGQSSLPLPEDVACIKALRYLVGNAYVPLYYDTGYETAQWSGTSGVVQFPSRSRLVGPNIYFNPSLSQAGPQYLQIEYASYPAPLTEGGLMPVQMDRSMLNYIKFRSASILASGVGKAQTEWTKFENQWATEIEIIIDKRVQCTTTIQEFEG